jgi:hypothetical protein
MARKGKEQVYRYPPVRGYCSFERTPYKYRDCFAFVYIQASYIQGIFLLTFAGKCT